MLLYLLEHTALPVLVLAPPRLLPAEQVLVHRGAP